MLTHLARATALLTLLASSAGAQEAEYRSFKLTDGRTMLGQVIETGAEGMRVRVPQGIATVPYALLGDIGAIDAATAEAQAALVVAVAPTQAGELDARSVAARVDGWLSDAVALVPGTVTLSPTAWEETLQGDGFQLLGCGGRVDCLADLAAKAGADRLLVPSLGLVGKDATLTLTGFVPAAGARLAEGTAPAGAAPENYADGALSAAFAALDVEPEIDVTTVAAARFPVAPAVVEAPPEPADPGPAAPPETADGDNSAPPTAPSEEPDEAAADAAPGEDDASAASDPQGPDEELLRTVALGFAPVPGLNGAVNKDLPAFLVALVGGVGTAWAAIYGVGTKARSPGEFAGPALGAAYGLVVAWNQAAGLAGLGIRRRAAAVPAVSVVPLQGPQGGAAVLVSGRF